MLFIGNRDCLRVASLPCSKMNIAPNCWTVFKESICSKYTINYRKEKSSLVPKIRTNLTERNIFSIFTNVQAGSKPKSNLIGQQLQLQILEFLSNTSSRRMRIKELLLHKKRLLHYALSSGCRRCCEIGQRCNALMTPKSRVGQLGKRFLRTRERQPKSH